MSQFIGDRIQRLQREIYVLLMLQQCSNKEKKPASDCRSRSTNPKKKNKSSIPVRVKSPDSKLCKKRSLSATMQSTLTVDFSESSSKTRPNRLVDIHIDTMSSSDFDDSAIIKRIINSPEKNKEYKDKSMETFLNDTEMQLQYSQKNIQTDQIKPTKKTKSTIVNIEIDTKLNEDKIVVLKDTSTDKLKKKKKPKCCNCRKQIEDAMKEANKTIELLQAQIGSSNANLELLTAGREFLSQTLKVLKSKYYELKQEYKELKCKNEICKNENKELCLKMECCIENQKGMCSNDEANKKLEKQNEEFHKILKKFEEEREEMVSLIKQQNDELEYLGTENNTLNKLLNDEKNLCCNYVRKFEEKILKLINLQESAQREIRTLRCISDSVKNLRYSQNNICLQNELNELRAECTVLKKRLSKIQEQEEFKCRKIEEEILKFAKALMANEQIVVNERDEILKVVQELSDVIAIHKSRINKLVLINKQQEGLLASQSALLKKKDEEIMLARESEEAVIYKTACLEKQLESLQASMSMLEKLHTTFQDNRCECGIEFIQNDLIKTRSSLKEEREKLQVKDKIIEDQADTIKNLKYNIMKHENCVKNTCSDVEHLIQQLKNERQVKKHLLSEIKDLEWQKTMLSDEIRDLREQEGKGDSEEIKRKLEEQNHLLSILEEQVATKQIEWQEQYYILNKEKTKAIEVAKFATRKLIETIHDFQNQTETQRHMRSRVVEIFHESYNNPEGVKNYVKYSNTQ